MANTKKPAAKKTVKKKAVAKKTTKKAAPNKKVASRKRRPVKEKFLDSVPKPVDEKRESILQSINDILLDREKVQRESKAIHIQIVKKRNYKIKFVTFGDTHFLLQNDDLLGQIMQDHGDADFAVHGGDVMDMNIVSLWPKDKYIPLEMEYRVAVEYFKKFSETWPNFYAISGNHCSRISKMFGSTLAPSVRFAAHFDLLRSLCEGYDLNSDGVLVPTHDFSNVHYQPGVDNWFLRIGAAAWFHHAGNSGMNASKASGQGVIAAKDWFVNRNADAQAFFQFHTHKISSTIKNGKLLIEPGATCLPMDYSAKSKGSLNGAAYGFAVGYMDKDGNVDFENTRPIFYGSDKISKETIDPSIAAKDNRPKKRKSSRN